jgi:hypothetical protein
MSAMATSAAAAVPRIPIDRERIAEFCRTWRITEFALFGSVLRDDFRPDSDVDVLVTFAEDADWNSEQQFDMIEELKALIGRDIDLVQKKNLKNPFRRYEILTTKQIVYAA